MNKLFQAINEDDIRAIGELLDDGIFDLFSTYLVDLDGMTELSALEYAAAKPTKNRIESRLDTIEYLISNGADASSYAPLLRCQRIELFELLLTYGADVDATDANFEGGLTSPIVLRVREANANIVARLLSEGADTEVESPVGKPLIHSALEALVNGSRSERSDLDRDISTVMNLLMENGTYVDAQDEENFTPLQRMVFWSTILEQEFPQILNVLLENGADVTVKNDNEAPLVSMFMESSIYRRAPFDAISRVLSNGADLSLTDFDINGDTALIQQLRGTRGNSWLLWFDDRELTFLLLSRGSDVNHRNNDGNTPLHIIVGRLVGVEDENIPIARFPSAEIRDLYIDVLKELLEAGADVRAKNILGNTPHDHAKKNPYKDVMRLLDQYDRDDFTSVNFSVQFSSAKLASRELLSADPKASQLRGTARELYHSANEAYKNIEGHTQPYIKINEGRRSTRRQATYFERWIKFSDFGGDEAPKAAVPGRGRHEYGVAMDIFRKLDEANYLTALGGNGWERTVMPSEPWHYAATGISDWNEVEKLRKEAAPLSETFSTKTTDYLRFEISEAETKNEYAISRREAQEKDRKFRTELNEFKTLSRKLKNAEADRARLQAQHETLTSRKNSAERRLSTSRYNRCPNGNNFDACGHQDLKANYLNEIQSLRRTIENLTNGIRQVRNKLDEIEDSAALRRRIDLKKRTAIKARSDFRKAKAEALEKRKLLRIASASKKAARREKDAVLDEIVNFTSGK